MWGKMAQRVSSSRIKDRARLVLHLTFECNARCAHCAFSCGAERKTPRLSPGEIRLAIESAKQHGFVSVHLSGGEPYLVPDLVEYSLKKARGSGLRISIETNASWAKTPAMARKVLTPWAKQGLNWLLLSYDRYHAAFIGPQCIVNACEQAEQLGLNIELRVTEPHDGHRQALLDNVKAAHRYMLKNAFYFPGGIGRGADLPSSELTLWTFMPLECTHFMYKQVLVTVFPGQLVAFNCEFGNPRLTYRYPLKEAWLADMIRTWNSDRCVADMWDHGLAAIARSFNAIKGQPCGFCFSLLPSIYRDKEAIDIRGLQ